MLHANACSHLQIETVERNNIASNLGQAELEFVLQLVTTHDLSSLRHLPQQLLETSEKANKGTFVDICHFTRRMRY